VKTPEGKKLLENQYLDAESAVAHSKQANVMISTTQAYWIPEWLNVSLASEENSQPDVQGKQLGQEARANPTSLFLWADLSSAQLLA